MKNQLFVGISLIAIFGGCSMSSQKMETPMESHRDVPEQDQFDFWLGDWYVDDTSSATNFVETTMNAMVIHEHFNSPNLVGESFSSYNKQTGMWQQTWVDNQGAYLDFNGKFEDGKMILSRSFIAQDGNPAMQRMIWRDITQNAFEWDWQGSRDGETWQTNWHLSYKRKMQ